MVRNGQISVADIKRIFRKYWWILPISTVLLSGLGLAATMVLPKRYTSSTMVLVEPPVVPREIVAPIVSDDLYHRLASIKEQILSRSRLQPIIDKLNLFSQVRGKEHIEDTVDRLRKAIDVELIQPIQGSTSRQPPGFRVSVTFDNPQIAQQICTEVTSMFIGQNESLRGKQAADTTHFLSQQLDEAKAKLDQQDAALAKFKQQYFGALPDQEQANLGLLSGMHTQLEAVTQSLSRAQQDKTFNETVLGQQEAAWKASQSGVQNPETQEQQIAILQAQLNDLLAKYTPEHPDVVKLRNEIQDLKRRSSDAPTSKSPGGSNSATSREPAQLQQLRARVRSDEANIVDLTKRQAAIQSQINVLQGRIQASPVVEQQFKELTRNYQTALEIYNDLLKKRESSAMATDLEHQQQGEVFKVLDAPSLPSSPSFPKKIIFVGGGLGAGLALGLAIMYLLAMMDKSMYTERDVETCLKMPVLAMVPSFDVMFVPAQSRSGKGSINKASAPVRAGD